MRNRWKFDLSEFHDGLFYTFIKEVKMKDKLPDYLLTALSLAILAGLVAYALLSYLQLPWPECPISSLNPFICP